MPEKVKLWPNIHDDLKNKPFTHKRLRKIILGKERMSNKFWEGTIQHYAASVSAVDEQIGIIISALEKNNILDNTVVVFIADHGDTCGAHGFLDKGVIAYEELVRVPLIVSCPEKFQKNSECDKLVSHIDILPTLADVAGIKLGNSIDGKSLIPFLKDRSVPNWRKYHFITHHGNMFGLCSMRAVIDHRYKFVYYPYDTCELYDLEKDPLEMNNLINIPKYKNIVSNMLKVLRNHMKENADNKFRPF